MNSLRGVRNAPVLLLTAVALVLGTAALLADTVFATPTGPVPALDATRIAPVELARWIRDGRPGFRLIDVRSPEAFDNGHIPTAINVPGAGIAGADFGATTEIILYDQGEDGDTVAERARVALLGAGLTSARVLSGGLVAWTSDVLRPRLAAEASASERRAFEDIAGLSRWFGGVPRVASPGEPQETSAARATAARRQGC